VILARADVDATSQKLFGTALQVAGVLLLWRTVAAARSPGFRFCAAPPTVLGSRDVARMILLDRAGVGPRAAVCMGRRYDHIHDDR
jgi:hypothetical protein